MQTLQRPSRCRAFGAANVRQLRRAHACRAQSQTVLLAQASSQAKQNGLPSLPPLDDAYESTVAFTDFANWLIPGNVLLGRYPYVEPSRCLRREQGEQQLQRILDTGVTTFVSLQAELPPQEKMTLAGKNGFLPYKATADLIRSAINGPPPMEIVEGLRNPMLDKFLPARKRHGVSYNPVELQFVHFPIVDLGLPNGSELPSLIRDLERRLAAGEKLYIHCWGGRGRAGTVGACLLAQLYDLPAAECLERIQRAFDTRQDGGRRSPETEEQVAFVEEYVKALKQ
ncbi:hypothetical protein PLESTB_001090400 [Pleodorina starrii]|uniref:Tyrosine specific protein phosphatases domain-containing protein n=1 Tax=Pleodorina starrii TaxID=330485 RepID=A0A9W6BQE5_9CHLO|nr:hypothetical protein PLESTM_000695900 [Pleodorina starrii]GLC56304.1 hypothetical protein PLESTB_001090400 [Pleodorina starrii]GLC69648.1 hypothetical protein PLESTF_000858800 [Pleodorina starrii]